MMIEEMIAAGWIKASDLDEDYQEHIKAFGAIDYEEWQHLRSEWQRLNALYLVEVEPYYMPKCEVIPHDVRKRGNDLVTQMVRIETALGY